MDRHDMNLWQHAVSIAEDEDRFEVAGPGNHAVIAVFPRRKDAEVQMNGETHDGIFVTSWCGPVLGRRTHNIVVNRRDYIEAISYRGERHHDRMLADRREWALTALMCRLVPGGRLILV